MSDSSFLWRITTLSSLISLPCNSSCQLGMLSLDRVLNPCLIYFKYVVFFHGRWEVVFLEIYAIRGSCHVIQSGEIRWSQWSTYRFKKVLKGQVLSSKLLTVLEKEEYLIFLYIYIYLYLYLKTHIPFCWETLTDFHENFLFHIIKYIDLKVS